MGSSSSALKEKAVLVATQCIESYIVGKIDVIGAELWNKLSDILTAYIKGETSIYSEDPNHQKLHCLLNKFVQTLPKLNTSTFGSPFHSELVHDTHLQQMKHQYFDIESKIRSNYQNLLDQNMDNFFRYFELENITRQLYDLLNIKTFFGHNPIETIMESTDYHYRKVNDFYIRYMQLVLKGMILVLTYYNLKSKPNHIDIQRCCTLFNELNRQFRDALDKCCQRMYVQRIIKQETKNIIKHNMETRKWMKKNPVNTKLCHKIYDYFNDKYDWNKWCCYVTRINAMNTERKPFSFWPPHRIYCTQSHGIYVMLMRVNVIRDISNKKLNLYKQNAKTYFEQYVSHEMTSQNSQFAVDGICKGLMDALSSLDSAYDVSVFVTMDKFGYFFQTSNELCYIRNIHRKYLCCKAWKVILCENGDRNIKKIQLRSEATDKYLSVTSNLMVTEVDIATDATYWNAYRYSRSENVVLLQSGRYRTHYLSLSADGEVAIAEKYNADGSMNTECILSFNRSYQRDEYCKWYGFIPKKHAFALKMRGYVAYVALQKGFHRPDLSKL